MKDSWLRTSGFSCYEQLRVVVDINDFGLWAQGSKYYEQLRVVDDMIELETCELKPIDGMNH